MKTILASIEAKRAEQSRLLAQLALWAEVKDQGIDIDTVKSFGFDESRLTNQQKAVIRKASLYRKPHPYRGDRLPCGKYACRVFNFVRHHDGTTTLLDPMVKAP